MPHKELGKGIIGQGPVSTNAGRQERERRLVGLSKQRGEEVVDDVIGETASDQSKLGLRDHGRVFEFYLKWLGKCLRVLSGEGPDLISRLEASSCGEGDRL